MLQPKAFDLDRLVWTAVQTSQRLSARAHFSLARHRDSVLVVGGVDMDNAPIPEIATLRLHSPHRMH
jgi:hypothetical protein